MFVIFLQKDSPGNRTLRLIWYILYSMRIVLCLSSWERNLHFKIWKYNNKNGKLIFTLKDFSNIKHKDVQRSIQRWDIISRSSVLPLNFNEQRFAHFKLSSDLCHQRVTQKQILKATMWVEIQGRISFPSEMSNILWNWKFLLYLKRKTCQLLKVCLKLKFLHLLVGNVKVHQPSSLSLFSNFYRLKSCWPEKYSI